MIKQKIENIKKKQMKALKISVETGNVNTIVLQTRILEEVEQMLNRYNDLENSWIYLEKKIDSILRVPEVIFKSVASMVRQHPWNISKYFPTWFEYSVELGDCQERIVNVFKNRNTDDPVKAIIVKRQFTYIRHNIRIDSRIDIDGSYIPSYMIC